MNFETREGGKKVFRYQPLPVDMHVSDRQYYDRGLAHRDTLKELRNRSTAFLKCILNGMACGAVARHAEHWKN